MKAIYGGKAKNDRIDAQKIAVLLRGGMLPQAYVYPAEMRATRDLLRRRMHLMRKRAELLTHIQNTNSQYNLPEIGKKIAYKANRDGVAERFAEPAVQKSIEADLALIDHYDHLLRDMELTILKTAKQHDANTLYLLRTVPGIGEILSLVLLSEIHDSQPSHACKILCRTAAWSNVPKNRPGSAMAPRGPRSAMRILNGRFRKQPSSFCGPILGAGNISPAWRKGMPRGKR